MKPSSTPTPTPSMSSRPPLVTLVIAGKEQIAGLGSYCWTYEYGRGLCVDKFGIPTAREALPADSPFTARLRLPIEWPVAESQLSVYPLTVDDQLDSEAGGLRWWSPKGEAREQFTLTLKGETIVELSLEHGATNEERHGLLQMMLDTVYVDMASGRVVGIRPKPEFLPLFNLREPISAGELALVTGDPEGI